MALIKVSLAPQLRYIPGSGKNYRIYPSLYDPVCGNIKIREAGSKSGWGHLENALKFAYVRALSDVCLSGVLLLPMGLVNLARLWLGR